MQDLHKIALEFQRKQAALQVSVPIYTVRLTTVYSDRRRSSKVLGRRSEGCVRCSRNGWVGMFRWLRVPLTNLSSIASVGGSLGVRNTMPREPVLVLEGDHAAGRRGQGRRRIVRIGASRFVWVFVWSFLSSWRLVNPQTFL